MLTNLGNIIDPDCNLEKIAIIDLSEEQPQHFSFRQIDQLSNAVARGLRSRGVKTGDKISILSNNSARVISTFFGAMRLGAIPVLINNRLTESQIQTILEETESKLLFSDQSTNVNISTIQFNLDFDSFINVGDFECYTPAEDDTAFILYTSGSYGNPKGALLSHKGHLWSINRTVKHDQKWSSKRISIISAPLFHANGLTTFESSFAGQATIVLLPKFDPLLCIKAIEDHKANTMYCVPTMLAMMFREDYIKQATLSSMRQIRSASSHLSQKLANSVKQYFPNAHILNSYGITEVGPALFGPHPLGLPRPTSSVGYPANGIEYRIVDDILHIKSPSMMSSYYNKTKNESFTVDGFFITKDVFRIDTDGFYYFLGRSDDMFKCGGNSVYPSQVESILESHPCVASAFVLGIEDDIKGHKPYAFVVLEKNKNTTEQELKQHVLDNGPAYQHPRRIWFLETFPLAGTNKVDKKMLENIATENLANQL
jgi:acyl-CoA synthetase (AMP-forming)/AMP-acid ligase II